MDLKPQRHPSGCRRRHMFVLPGSVRPNLEKVWASMAVRVRSSQSSLKRPMVLPFCSKRFDKFPRTANGVIVQLVPGIPPDPIIGSNFPAAFFAILSWSPQSKINSPLVNPLQWNPWTGYDPSSNSFMEPNSTCPFSRQVLEQDTSYILPCEEVILLVKKPIWYSTLYVVQPRCLYWVDYPSLEKHQTQKLFMS